MKYFVSLILLFSFSISAEIVTDGTLGDAVNVTGPDYSIDQSLGQQSGSNLFHSFDKFNLTQQESATFTGSSHITNVIARITGGKSSIDGAVNCDIDGANLFLINQAGILFGKNASLNLTGSFYTSTANFLEFADNQRFYASPINGAVLSSASPQAFGFLGQNGKISVNGSHLAVKDGHRLTISANGIDINSGAKLTAEQGCVCVTSLTAGRVVPGNSQIKGADLKISGGSMIDCSGYESGEVYIKGGEVYIDNSKIEVDTKGKVAGGVVDIKADTLNITDHSLIRTIAKGDGSSAAIKLKAEHILLGQGSMVKTLTEAKGKSGNSGEITVEAESVELDNSFIKSEASQGRGVTGSITVNARRLRLADKSVIISSKIGSGSGTMGAINLNIAEDLFISGSFLTSEVVLGRMKGGGININTGKLTLTDRASILSLSRNRVKAGNINISADQVDVLVGSKVSTSSLKNGDGGDITLNVTGGLTIDGTFEVSTGSKYASGIYSRSVNAGDGGDVLINAGAVRLSNGGFISTASENETNPGAAGDIFIQTASMEMENGKVTAESTGATGGHIDISAQNYLSLFNSEISTKVHGGMSHAGNIDIETEAFALNNSMVRTNAFGGDGGNIHIDSEVIMKNYESYFDASSELGVSGNIILTAPEVYLNEETEELVTQFLPAEEWVYDSARARLGNRSSFVINPHPLKLSKLPEFYSVPIREEKPRENVVPELKKLLGF